MSGRQINLGLTAMMEVGNKSEVIDHVNRLETGRALEIYKGNQSVFSGMICSLHRRDENCDTVLVTVFRSNLLVPIPEGSCVMQFEYQPKLRIFLDNT